MKEMLNSILRRLLKLLGWAYIPYHQDFNGLGNRIKGVVNFYSYGHRKFLMLWQTKGWVSSPFDDLFSLEGCTIKEINEGLRYTILGKVLRRFLPTGIITTVHPFWSYRLPDDFTDNHFVHEWSFAKGHPIYSIDWRYNDIPNILRERFRPFFEALRPSTKVLMRLKAFESTYGNTNYIAVHIRNSNLKEDAKDVCSVSSILEVMKRFPSETKFFISAMTPDVSKEIHATFPNQILELPNKDYSSMIDAVADMWLLGQGKELICSPSSTFSEVAWWWGGAKAPTIMLNSEYNQRNL